MAFRADETVVKLCKAILMLSLFATIGGGILAPFARAQTPPPAELTKARAFEILKTNGPRWKQADLPAAEADAKLTQATSALFPHLSFAMREYIGRVNQIQFGFAEAGSLSVFTAGSTGFELRYGVFDLAAWARVSAAQSNQKSGVLQSAQYRNEIIFLMLAQFLNAQRLGKRLEVLDAVIRQDEEILEVANARQRAGVGISLDLMRASGLLESARLKKLDATIAHQKAVADLGMTLGQSHFDAALEPLVFKEIPDEWVNRKMGSPAVEQRADVQASRLLVSAAESMKAMAQRERAPKILLYGDIGLFGTHAIGIGSTVTGTAGLQLSLPLLNWGLISGRVEEQGVQLQKAELQSQQIELEANAQIDSSKRQLLDARSAVQLSKKQLEIAQEELKLARSRFMSGSVSGLELSNSQSNLANASDMNVEATFAYEAAKVNCFRAIGAFDEYFEFDGGRAP